MRSWFNKRQAKRQESDAAKSLKKHESHSRQASASIPKPTNQSIKQTNLTVDSVLAAQHNHLSTYSSNSGLPPRSPPSQHNAGSPQSTTSPNSGSEKRSKGLGRAHSSGQRLSNDPYRLRSASSTLSAAYSPEIPYHSVYCMFQQACERTPDEIALVGDRIPQLQPTNQSNENTVSSWTYRELFELVDKYSASLLELWGPSFGLDGHFRAGLYLPRSVDSIIVMLACQKLGATMVPLDVHYPPVKTIQMIAAAGLHTIITVSPAQSASNSSPSSSSRQASYPTIDQLVHLARHSATDPISNLIKSTQVIDLIHVNEFALGVADEPLEMPCCCCDSEGKVSTSMFGTSYLLFTSGSTGVSKSVGMTHYQLAIHIASLCEKLPVHAGDVFSPMASLCFVAHTRLWSSLVNSACLLIPNDQQRTSIIPYANLLKSVINTCGMRVSILDTSPAFLRMMLADWNALISHSTPDALACLRRVTMAGEIVTWKLTAQVYERHDNYLSVIAEQLGQPIRPILSMVNLYGATECASTIAAYIVPRVFEDASVTGKKLKQPTFVPVGAPLPTTKIYLLDNDGVPMSDEAVFAGQVGHVHVAGMRIELAPGYDADSASTSMRFIRHYQLEHQRLFKTGDMGRLSVNGDLELVGRSDNMVKIRGQRVELEELESTLAKSESVAQVMVSAVRDDGFDEEATIVAFVVPSKQMLEALAASPVSSPRHSEGTPHFAPLGNNVASLMKLQSMLRSEVSKSHPFYYVPKHFVFVNSLARTPNGKLDRQAGKAAAAQFMKDAREIEKAASAATESENSEETKLQVAEITKQLTESEQGLWSIWLQVFPIASATKQLEILNAVMSTKQEKSDSSADSVGADDFDFFAMGGDSLLANQLVSLINQQMRKSIPVRDVFEGPSLIELAAKIAEAPEAEEADQDNNSSSTQFPVPASQEGVDQAGRSFVDYDMSLNQQGMWWVNEIAGSKLSAHHITHIYELHKSQIFNQNIGQAVNVRALETSIEFLIARHEGLRTVFVTNASGEPKQRVLSPGGSSELPSQNLIPALSVKVGVQTVNSLEAMQQTVESSDHTPFDLKKFPLFRVSLIKVEQGDNNPKSTIEGQAFLSITIHHLVSDGWATGLLLKELSAAYAHFSDPNASRRFSVMSLSHPTLSARSSMQYSQFQQSILNRLSSVSLKDEQSITFAQKSTQFWVDQLKDAAYLELPYDYSRPLQRTYRGDFIHAEFPASLSQSINQLSSITRVSVFNLLLASFHLLLSKYSKSSDIVTGTASANRESIHAQNVMGYCINMVANRSIIDPKQTFVEFAKATQKKTLDGLEHGALPFQTVVDAVGKAKKSSQGKDDMSRNPIFDVILLLQNQPIRRPFYALNNDDSLTLHRKPFRAQHAQFDLAFLLEPIMLNLPNQSDDAKGLQLAVNYNCDVWRRETIERMVDNWMTLLSRLTTQSIQQLTVASVQPVPMASFDWISESQRKIVVESFNHKFNTLGIHQTFQPTPTSPIKVGPDHVAHHAFEKYVEQNPDGMAVKTFDSSWTYQQLENNANRVAHCLIDQYKQRYGENIKTDILIGLYVDRAAGQSMPAAVLGILKSGAAYVPLDPTYPTQRLGYMIHDSRAKIILTVRRMRSDLDALIAANNEPANIESGASGLIPETPVICIDELLSQQELLSSGQSIDPMTVQTVYPMYPISRPPRINCASSLAYVIFTSGSTGKPKGVMINHISIVNLAAYMAPFMHTHSITDALTHQPTKKKVVNPHCLQFSSISFDVAVFEWATTFSSGGCLCLVPSVDHLLGEALLATVNRYGITTLLASASSVAAVPLKTGADGGPAADLSKLSFMSAGSEALQEAVLHRWMKACPQAFFNQYGPTEVTVTSHMCHYQPQSINPYHNNKVIGGGIANVHSYVLDDSMQPVPIGVVGELFIGGAGVARGYLNRPDLTEQRFVPNLFLTAEARATQPNECGLYEATMESTRIYRTGDLVRWTPTGELEYHGRNDDQVKVRGFRIEIGEIEKRILQHPAIRGTVVVLRKEKQNGAEEPVPTLVCFFTYKSPNNPTMTHLDDAALIPFVNEMRAHVGSALPSYMVPTYFIHLEEIPQSCTGKFDRNTLTAMDISEHLNKLNQQRLNKKGKKSKAPAKLAVPSKATKVSEPKSPSSPRSARLTEQDLIDAVRSAWATALSLDADDIELTDHFFELGGHSLLTIRILQLLPPSLKPLLQLADVFANPTLNAQVDLLKQRLIESDQQNHTDLFDSTPTLSSGFGVSLDSIPTLKGGRHMVEDIAIVGMAGRFPASDDVHSFWQHLVDGDECIRAFTDEELIAAGIDRNLVANTNYVKKLGLMGQHTEEVNSSHAKSVFGFDASYFEFSAKESELMDPQQRLFLEVCAQALEDAGCNPSTYQAPDAPQPRAIGVFAGCGRNTYLMDYLSASNDLTGANQAWHALVGANDKDFLCSRVSYKLNLHGPAVVIQSACSSSLVAVHQAIQSIQAGQCTMALAGGVSLGNLHPAGYLYQPDHILAPDGHCRAFDSKAAGTVRGQGMAVIAIKSLAEAQRDRDQIYAVLKASAINNDGSSKASYSAPNPEGQRRVISQAFGARPEIEPASIGYVECHGTATKIGDVIELSALSRAYQTVNQSINGTDSKFEPASCAIGSVKSNVGHLDAAAGVTGLIKAALVVQRAVIPASLHYHSTQPAVDLSESPFYVTAGEARQFEGRMAQVDDQSVKIRRAAVSSFGIGGTNAHVILEQRPEPIQHSLEQSVRQHVLVWTAKSVASIRAMTSALLKHFKHLEQSINESKITQSLGSLFSPDAHLLENVAFTLQQRVHHPHHRRTVVAASISEAISQLQTLVKREETALIVSKKSKSINPSIKPPVGFFFSGQGSHFTGMGVKLYQRDLAFKAIADETWSRIVELPVTRAAYFSGVDTSTFISQSTESLVQLLNKPVDKSNWMAPIALFALELSLAWRLMRAGVLPTHVIGHSLGHFAASVIAGKLSFSEAAIMVVSRACLIASTTAQDNGSMVAISGSPEEVKSLIAGSGLEIAGYNSATSTVVAGATDAITKLVDQCTARSVRTLRLHTSHAFHSRFVDSILPAYRSVVHHISENRLTDEPFSNLRFIGTSAVLADTVTGSLSADHSVMDVEYWINHTRQAVLFDQACSQMVEQMIGSINQTIHQKVVCVEIGPGRTGVTLMQQSIDSRGLTQMAQITTHQSLCGWVDINKTKPTQMYIADDDWHMNNTIATAFENGTQSISWFDMYDFDGRDAHVHKVSLPAYQFDHSNLFCPQRALDGKRTRWIVTQPQSQNIASPTASPMSATSEVSPLPESPLLERVNSMDDIRLKICGLFTDCLGSTNLTDESDFFEDGGDSLMAVSFTASINAAFNLTDKQTVRTSTLLVAKTIGELTSHVARALNVDASGSSMSSLSKPERPSMEIRIESSQSSLVAPRSVSRSASTPALNSFHRVSESLSPAPLTPTIKSSTSQSKPFNHLPRSFGPLYVLQWGSFRPEASRLDAQFLPLVLVHAVGGDILQYRALTALLHPNQPVFAFRAESLDGDAKPIESITSMAARYIDVLLDEDSPFRSWARIVSAAAASSFGDEPSSPFPDDYTRATGVSFSAVRSRKATMTSVQEESNYSPSSSRSSISLSESIYGAGRVASANSLCSLNLSFAQSLNINTAEYCASSVIPIALAGHSFGGLVAFEMAAQLKQRQVIDPELQTTRMLPAVSLGCNETADSLASAWPSVSSLELAVSKLVLIDSPAPSQLPPKLDRSGVVEYVSANRLNNATDAAASINPSIVDTWLAHQEAMHTYKSEQSATLVQDIETLFVRPSTKNMKSEHSGPGLKFHEAWLDILTDGLTIAKVSGDHLSMIRDQPHAQQTANKIRQFTQII